MGIIVNDALQMARARAAEERRRAELPEVQQAALEQAIDRGDDELSAAIAREIRNRLLKESDEFLVIDRFGIDLPETVNAGTMLLAVKGLIEGLRNVTCNPWADYRQALRDLPEQKGFPLRIKWPDAPGVLPSAWTVQP